MSVWILLSLVLALGLGAFMAGAFFEPALAEQRSALNSAELGVLYDSKERSLRALKDLELDYSMGKLSTEDFEQAKRELSLEAVSILDEIRRHEER